MRYFIGFVLSLLSITTAQTSLVLNGHTIKEVSTSLVNGFTYVPAQSLVTIFNGQSVEAGEGITLLVLGHSFEFEIAANPAEAVQISGALRFDGQVKASTAAVRDGSSVFVPLRSFIEVLGGSIVSLPEQQRIVALTLRSDIIDARLAQNASSERIIISFSTPSTYHEDYDPEQNLLRISFDQTNLANPWQTSGRFIGNADLAINNARPQLALRLSQGMTYNSFASREASGFKLIIDVFPETQTQSSRIIELAYDGQSRAAVERLKELLESADLTVLMTSFNGIKNQFGSDMFLVLTETDIPEGFFNLYYPQEQSATRAVQIATQAVVPPQGLERVFEDIETDYLRISQNAERLSRLLSVTSSYEANIVSSAPLAHAGSLSDTVVILELNQNTLADDSFLGFLSTVILTSLGER